ncbi:TetR/AcrR family transcriptional regulator [Myxococcota bacterium]|nr:TetR/AcrR family transcriptional regulator [Myxococcota bacterium]
MNVRSGDKVRQIYESTFALIAEKGIHNTPMTAISKHSGVATGTIYHHFESKEVLINALYLSLKEEMISAVMYGHEAEKSYEAKFIRIWLNYCDYLSKNPNILSFVEQCANTPIVTDETQERAEAVIAPLTQFFQAGIDEGYLNQDNVFLIVSLLHGSAVSVAKLHNSGRLALTDEVRRSVAEFCWKGLS